MPRTAKILPKLPELTKLQALLLLGGAFVFVALLWALPRYRIASVPAALPEGAPFAAAVLDRSEDWAVFEARLPEEARTALAGEAVATRWAILPRDASAAGVVRLGGRVVPFTLFIDRGVARAEVGRGYRGLDIDTRPLDDPRRLLAPIPDQTAYLEKPAGISWGGIAGLLDAGLQRFRGHASLWGMPGRVELAVSATETSSLSPFVLFYRPVAWSPRDEAELTEFAKRVLAEAGPVGFEVALPDGTSMTELRLEPDAVRSARREVRGYGYRQVLTAPEEGHMIDAFFADDGEAWLSTNVALTQTALTGSIGSDPPDGRCERGGDGGFATFKGPFTGSWPVFALFHTLTFSIHSLETGLFTICGYFTP